MTDHEGTQTARQRTAPRGLDKAALIRRPRGREREVLEVGAQVFAHKGYAAATVQDVADALGILKGSLYYYIETKEDLLYNVIVEVHEGADALYATVAEADLSAFERLLLYVRLQLEWNVQNDVKIAVYYNDMRQLSDARLADVRERAKTHARFISELIAEAQRDRAVTTAFDAIVLANQVLAIVISPYRWFRPTATLTTADLIAACEAFVRGGLAGGASGG